MYTREEASQIRQAFWTTFGQYLAPIPGAEGLKVNWVNYKTGYRGLYFRMDATARGATIGIVMAQRDPHLRQLFYEQWLELQGVLHATLGEEWTWQPDATNDLGQPISWIGTSLEGVNIFQQTHWPQLIGFFKPRILALDEFWAMAQVHFLPLKEF